MAEQGFFPWKEFQQLVSSVPSVIQNNFIGDEPLRRPSPASPPVRVVQKRGEKTEEKTAEAEPDLVSELKPTPIVEVPKEVIDQVIVQDNDWEILSDKASHSSLTGGGIFVPRAGSVRSITSIDHESSSHTTLSLPFKIQRTNSSSTLDSQDNTLGPSGKGVLGVDYVEHIVLPTDTLQGVCLSYKVSASNLRRANHFSGQSLHSAPKKLLIPLSKQALRTGFIRVQDTDTKEYKLHYFQAEYPDLSLTEAKAYLELADWELKEALQSAKEDREWEKEEIQREGLKSGQISLRINFKSGKPLLNFKGIGRSPPRKDKSPPSEAASPPPKPKQKVIIHSNPPAIATKSVLAEDLYNAASQHSNFGLEMKPLPKRDP